VRIMGIFETNVKKKDLAEKRSQPPGGLSKKARIYFKK
jgi:hypothetical protein